MIMKNEQASKSPANPPLPPAPGSAMPCGCPVADIPITLALEGLEGPEAVQGYTCKCGRCFYPEPQCSADLRPGSPEALDAGCKCPVLDNAHGAGYLGLGKVWVMTMECPLHGKIAAGPPNTALSGDERKP